MAMARQRRMMEEVEDRDLGRCLGCASDRSEEEESTGSLVDFVVSDCDSVDIGVASDSPSFTSRSELSCASPVSAVSAAARCTGVTKRLLHRGVGGSSPASAVPAAARCTGVAKRFVRRVIDDDSESDDDGGCAGETPSM